jgi:5-methylcytosine-specific restriction endonuclease McrA
VSHSANWLSKETRANIIASFDKHCVYCGAALRVRAGRQDGLDHVRPRARGGSNKVENLVACCGTCNASKGDLHLAQWLTTTDRGKAAMRRLAPVVAALLDCAGPIVSESTQVDSDSEVPF